MTFFKNFLSLDEAKISSLIIGFLFSLAWAIYRFHIDGDISDNWLSLIGWFIVTIGGVNLFEKLSGVFKK